MGLQKSSGNTTFIGIVGGKFVQTVDEDTEGAVRRDWEVGKNSGTKWELIFDRLSGVITNIHYRESNYGEQLNLRVKDGAEEYTVSIKANKEYAIEFAEKLPNIDLQQEVVLVPSEKAHDTKKDQKVRRLFIYQDNDPVYNYYYDFDNKKNINGMPEPSAKTKTEKNAAKRSALWKQYFDVDKYFFLQDEVNKAAKILEDTPPPVRQDAKPKVEAAADSGNDDLPF